MGDDVTDEDMFEEIKKNENKVKKLKKLFLFIINFLFSLLKDKYLI